MKSRQSRILTVLAAALFAASLTAAGAAGLGPVVDDFNNPAKTTLGSERLFIDDTTAGGKTTVEHRIEDGVISVNGAIVPPRGQPGWASLVLLLDPMGLPQDASAYAGIRILVRINKGNLAISANSTEISNYDYHAAPIQRHADGEFHEVKIPFVQLKRAWSEQTPLNIRTLASLSLVAIGLQPESFDYEIKEVGFY